MLGIYLSGTGNTEHCITKLLGLIDSEAENILLSFLMRPIWFVILSKEIKMNGRERKCYV